MLEGKRSTTEVYRTRTHLGAGIVATGSFGLIALTGATYSPALVGKLVWGGVALVLVLVLGRAAYSKLAVGEFGVKVTNPLSSFYLRWDEIKRFEIGQSGILDSVCLIHTIEGQVKHAFGIQQGRISEFGADRPAAEIVAGLNRRLEGEVSDC